MKKIAILITSITLLLMPLVVFVNNPVYADANSDVKSGIDAANSSGGPSIDAILKNGLNLFSFIIGVVAVIMIMVGGFKFITANGDAGQVSSARNTILYAIVGLVIAALAQVIVKFVLGRVSGH